MLTVNLLNRTAGAAAPVEEEETVRAEPPRPTTYYLQLDSTSLPGNMQTGAQDLHTIGLLANLGVQAASDKLGISSNVWGRLFQGLFIDLPLMFYTGGVAHEIWGHGARAREDGCSYSSNLLKWGAISGLNCGDRVLSEEQLIQITTGGTEATQYFAHFTAQQMMFRGSGSYPEALMYLDTKLDITNYILNWNNPQLGVLYPDQHNSTYNYPFINNQGDVSLYWEQMAYKRLSDLQKSYTLSEIAARGLWHGPNFNYSVLRAGAIWNSVLDPTLWLAAYQIGNYIASGEREFKMPVIWPRTNFVLTPAGPDFYLRLPFRFNHDKMMIDPYIRKTFNHSDNAYGAGYDLFQKYDERLSVRTGLDVWEQSNKLGVSVRVGGDYQCLPGVWCRVMGAYKTDGYAFGQPQEKGITLSFGIGLRF